jgi:hypothetical protein
MRVKNLSSVFSGEKCNILKILFLGLRIYIRNIDIGLYVGYKSDGAKKIEGVKKFIFCCNYSQNKPDHENIFCNVCSRNIWKKNLSLVGSFFSSFLS